MTSVLVCVKRVPDSSSEVVLTDDAQAVDGRYAGFTTSAHEECAVELAAQITAADGGEATVLTLGDEDAVEQLRSSLAVGCHAATHIVAEAHRFGPADVAREIAAVVRDHEAATGRFFLDPCNLHPGEADVVAPRLIAALRELRGRPVEEASALISRRRFERLTQWPD